MAQITFTITAQVAQRLGAAMVALYPIPTDAGGAPLYTADDWGKEKTRQWWISQIMRSEQKTAAATAAAAVVAVADGDIT